jgi:large subunit ribosomal protein L23
MNGWEAKMSKTLDLRPRLSEKAYALSELTNTYVFDVPAGSTKHTVAKAVEVQYEVGVNSVRIAHVPGKVKKSYRKKRTSSSGKRSDIRKAYVTLKEGDKLPIFAAVEEAAKEDK